jgi:hypothetical protein
MEGDGTEEESEMGGGGGVFYDSVGNLNKHALHLHTTSVCEVYGLYVCVLKECGIAMNMYRIIYG